MFNKYNDRSRQSLLYAREAARCFNHGYIGTEHMLIGIAQEGGPASEILKEFNVDVTVLKNKIIELIGYGNSDIVYEDIFLTPNSKRLVEMSLTEAGKENSEVVTPEHMIMALINHEECVGHTILLRLDVDVDCLSYKLGEHMKSAARNKNANVANAVCDERPRTYNTPILDKYGKDLTESARVGKLDPVIGRALYTDRMMEVLCRRLKNNPCLIGNPGVGKTAIVEGLAHRMYEGKVPDNLINKRLVSIDMVSMVAGAKYRGDFEERLKSLMEEVVNSKNVIVFIDEIHTIVGAGGAEGAIDASNILKPLLARGELQCIGATTIDEYRKYIEKDSALERRFHPIIVDEPSKEETEFILRGLREKYENHHDVTISDEAVTAAVDMSERYIPDRFLPDKAIDLVDEACAKKKIEVTVGGVRNGGIKEYNYIRPIVRREDIAAVLSTWTNIPVEKINKSEIDRLINLENIIHDRIVGQDEAVRVIANAVKRSRVGFRDNKRPIGSFIFLGPTGVGKTELCKALAEALFGDEGAIIKIDMTEYMEKQSVSKLIGSPPGYVGYDEGGQLTEKVRRKPYSIVVFDEIEKAHEDIFNILLQILDEGRLTDSKGRTVSFKNTIIIMTSNVGTGNLNKKDRIGFGLNTDSGNSDFEVMKTKILSEMKEKFKPEFINRIDETVVFRRLCHEELLKITDNLLRELCNRASKNQIYMEVTDAAKEFLCSHSDSRMFGARPLRRNIQSMVEDLLYDEMLKGNLKKNDNIYVDCVDNKIRIIK